uniref:Uncharacterized protein n=1 Tax=Anopheles farauti TaxID=69004 RepID=A0A182Q757_9DIPT
MDNVRSLPFRWLVLASWALLCYPSLSQHPMVSAVELGGGGGGGVGAGGKQMAAKHTATDHVREILGRAFGRDDHSYSGSHISSSSDERSGNGGLWGKYRDTCRYVSRSGKFCKCHCHDRHDH